MITNVDGSISTTIVNIFDNMLLDDYYVLFKVDDYTYTLAHGSEDDFALGSASITGSDVELINYKRADAGSGYSSYYYIDTGSGDVSVNFDSTIVYSNLVEYCPKLPTTEERSSGHAQVFASMCFFIFFSICVIFNLFGSLRFRVERRHN